MLIARSRSVFIALSLFALVCGCTARDLYSAGQDYQREQCRSGPPADYERCMQQANESYDTYQRKRREVEHNP